MVPLSRLSKQTTNFPPYTETKTSIRLRVVNIILWMLV
jgi:hypothetical protein